MTWTLLVFLAASPDAWADVGNNPIPGADLPPTVGDVLAMMAKVPGRAGDPHSAPYRWDQKKSAPAVALAIVHAAPSRLWAARMTVYAIFESSLETTTCVVGDGGKSFGVWQLQTDRAVACDPERAAPAWLAKAEQSQRDCARLQDAEQLAELASGSCDKGRRLARAREVLVLGLLGS